MKITWSITKKRGNWRPVLEYAVILDDWEKELQPQIPHVETNIPEPPEKYRKKDRGTEANPEWEPEGYYMLDKTGRGAIFLPWRPGANPDYPEVQEAMSMLRDAVEAAIIEAHDSLALEVSGELEMSAQGKRHVAAYVAARKMLGDKTQ